MKAQFRVFSVILIVILISVLLSGCLANSADTRESRSVQQQQQQYVTGQPVPQFTWSLERHEMIEIYKARNNAISTYSVVYNPYKGIIAFQCPSVGYPIPGGTELTNSEAFPLDVNGQPYYSGGPLPQPEPNGLFSPGTSAGTYVMCRSSDGTAYPVYVEENVMTFPYLMAVDANGMLIKANETDKPSINIDLTNPQP